jgi:dihydropteroate synthase
VSAQGPVLAGAGRRLSLDTPRVMGVLNVTPDSFSDGGRLYRSGAVDLDGAVRAAATMAAAGASIIDVGGESTRPGAQPVALQEELDRVVPVVERLAREVDVMISVDTSRPELMTAAAAAGAHLINDVRALTREGALAAARATGLPVCLMHMQGTPETMQAAPGYTAVVDEVLDFLLARARACHAAGIGREAVVIDPGFGFGKSVAHNLELLAGLPRLAAAGYPVLAGLSRKSLIGKLIGRPVEQRLAASLALAVLAAERGAAILRVHDVAETADALAMVAALGKVATL